MNANKQNFGRVALIGIGLIGSSLARIIKRDGLADHIVVSARTEDSLNKALELGIADSVTLETAEAVKDADIVVICTPMGAYKSIIEAAAPALKKGAIVTDVGSVKGSALNDLGPHIPEGVHLIPAHPVAGTEHSGPEAGFAELFEDRWCILTPPPGADEGAIKTITDLWQATGANIEIMDAGHHDLVMAMTSHIPHLIAYTIVGTATDLENSLRDEVIKFSAGGFRDFTRIAASDPSMWRDVFLNNREAVLEMLQRFNEDLTAMQRAIRWGEADTLYELFERTREIRRGVIDAKQA
ncbi:MAG: prephenate/arogenate dehydrogenase family protein [Rhodospirillales bacterium]|nr:prephenate/arogenate dehydrogenase family protein [Rhodospirillales bacterium]